MESTQNTFPGATVQSPPADAARVAEARRRVAAMKGFYIHLFIFAVVLTGLFAINAFSGRGWWVLWVLFGWGIGVVAHAIGVFGRTPQMVAEWEERKVQQLARDGR